MRHTYRQIATNYDLWGRYVDPQGLDTEEAFHAMTMGDKMALQATCFGEEAPTCDLCGRDCLGGEWYAMEAGSPQVICVDCDAGWSDQVRTQATAEWDARREEVTP